MSAINARRRWASAAGAISTLAVAAVALSGCSLSHHTTAAAGSLAKDASLKGATLTVGGKEFTEELILCQVTVQALESAGATVNQKCGLTGSDTTRKALTSGKIDMYWEYTGTAWIDLMHHTKPIADPTQQYKQVASEDLSKNHIVWLDPAQYNSTYAIVAKTDVAKKDGIATLSDYAKLASSNPSDAGTCVASEFEARSDGWPGLEAKYGFKLPGGNLASIDEGAIYNAVAKGNPCNFGEGDTTDGRIKALGLTVLTDDKGFFPSYNPALTVRESVAKANPNIAKVMNPIASALDLSTIQDLDAKVDVDGQEPEKVAQDWLQSKGFIGK